MKMLLPSTFPILITNSLFKGSTLCTTDMIGFYQYNNYICIFRYISKLNDFIYFIDLLSGYY